MITRAKIFAYYNAINEVFLIDNDEIVYYFHALAHWLGHGMLQCMYLILYNVPISKYIWNHEA